MNLLTKTYKSILANPDGALRDTFFDRLGLRYARPDSVLLQAMRDGDALEVMRLMQAEMDACALYRAREEVADELASEVVELRAEWNCPVPLNPVSQVGGD